MNWGMAFPDIFKQSIKVKEPIGMVMEFSQSIRIPRYKKHIFVESETDQNLYGNCLNYEISEKYCKYYPASIMETEVVGKRAVLMAAYQINNAEGLKQYYEKCIFIVDRDYDESLQYFEATIPLECLQNIWITKGHSLENYYFQKENLKTFISYLPTKNVHFSDIYPQLAAFFKERSKYFASWGIVSLHYDKVKENLDEGIAIHDEIFRYDENNEKWIDEKKYEVAVKKREKCLKRYKDLLEEYRNLIRLIEASPLIYSRGHDVYYSTFPPI